MQGLRVAEIFLIMAIQLQPTLILHRVEVSIANNNHQFIGYENN